MDAVPGRPGALEIQPSQSPFGALGNGSLQIRPHTDNGKFCLAFVEEKSARENQQEIDPEVGRILARGAMEKERLSGPIQFVLRLLDSWRLGKRDIVAILGFGPMEAAHVDDVLEGLDHFRGRDVHDRIAHLFRIRETLDSLFRNLDAENQWLREPHVLLDDKSPLSLLLGGSMEDILLTREYVDAAAGR